MLYAKAMGQIKLHKRKLTDTSVCLWLCTKLV